MTEIFLFLSIHYRYNSRKRGIFYREISDAETIIVTHGYIFHSFIR